LQQKKGKKLKILPPEALSRQNSSLGPAVSAKTAGFLARKDGFGKIQLSEKIGFFR
jgi:hypothetical protein